MSPAEPLPARLGLIAGAGEYPVLVADRARGQGVSVYVAALDGVAELGRFAGCEVEVFRLGQLASLLRALAARGITDLLLIGSLPRPSFANLAPELATLRYLPHFAKAFRGGDDHLLRGVVAFFEGRGFRVHGPATIAPDLLAPGGALGRQVPQAVAETAIATGFALLEALSPFDVGQGVVVADHRVVAVEAAEGTSAMLARVGDLVTRGRLKFARGDGVLVKAPKRDQDVRVDMPAIGAETLALARAAGLAGIALRAGGVLVGDRARLAAAADLAGLFVTGRHG